MPAVFTLTAADPIYATESMWRHWGRLLRLQLGKQSNETLGES